MPPQPPLVPNPDAELRERALVHLKKKRDFFAHLLVYIMVNSLLIVVWAMTSHGFFWPIFPIAGWGIGVVMNAWDVWHGDFSEEQVAHEMERLQRHR
ncbi:MAG TPA: 2TM domain-containing protein [Nocardioides sp.]|uniref:2TM domain-containing protein n=1 Tax=Nocardioides sp. TaxID=35761 RepID=UPI002E379429|nr:2TM domain-containing protein [Nocardioides sp.]HEX5088153.1 2TM domain-containing protein [Nocardioides sp.]